MLRPQPTSISLTVVDITRTAERIVARERAGKARIRQGPERSRDEAIRSMGCVPSLRPPMSAVCFPGPEDTGSLAPRRVPKFLLTSASRTPSRTRPASSFNLSSASSEDTGSDISDLVVPHQRARETSSGVSLSVGVPSGRELSQLHLDGQVDFASAPPTPKQRQRQHHLAHTNVLNAPSEMRHRMYNRPPLEQARSPLHESYTMSSPNVLSSPQLHHWQSMQQMHDAALAYQYYHGYAPRHLEPSRSAPNLGASAAGLVQPPFRLVGAPPGGIERFQYDPNAMTSSLYSNAPVAGQYLPLAGLRAPPRDSYVLNSDDATSSANVGASYCGRLQYEAGLCCSTCGSHEGLVSNNPTGSANVGTNTSEQKQYGVGLSGEENYSNSNNQSSNSVKWSSGSSSASVAAANNRPSGLDYVSNEAALMRARVSTLPPEGTRLRRNRELDLLRRADIAGGREARQALEQKLKTPAGPLASPISPAFFDESSERYVSAFRRATIATTDNTDGGSSDLPDILHEPTMRHRRGGLRRGPNRAVASIVHPAAETSSTGPQALTTHAVPDNQAGVVRIGEVPRLRRMPARLQANWRTPAAYTTEITAPVLNNGLASPTLNNGLTSAGLTNGLNAPGLTHPLASLTTANGSTSPGITSGFTARGSTIGLRQPSNTYNGMTSSMRSNGLTPPSTNRFNAPISTNSLRSLAINDNAEGSPALNDGISPDHRRVQFAPFTDGPSSMPSTRVSDLAAQSLVSQTQANADTHDRYARNNDFMARMASAERLDMEMEMVRINRPTPPPAVGHGRPRTGSNAVPRARSRSSNGGVELTSVRSGTIPRWQRNQENSEEGALAGLQEEFIAMHVSQESDIADDSAVMNNTPPHETRVDRYLRRD